MIRSDRPVSSRLRIFAAIVFAMAMVCATAMPVAAQSSGGGNGMSGMGMTPSPPPRSMQSPGAPLPLSNLKIMQPLMTTMIAVPPAGTAPLTVGFFVTAHDPDNVGLLTFQWNFGDGTVSSLPPERYLPHTYKKPGNYICTLTVKTPDGRSQTVFSGIVVRPPTD